MTAVRKTTTPMDDPVVRAKAITEQLATLGARYDAAPVFPVESMKLLSGAGLHRAFAPVESGGMAFGDPLARNQCLMTVLRLVGRADLSVGRLYEGHVNALALFDWYGSVAQRADLRQALAQGAFYGVWATEPQPGVKLHNSDNGTVILQGSKCFATGAGGLAYAIITAQPAERERQLVIVPANDAKRADLSQWRVRGMRATGSGLYDLTGMNVAPDRLLGLPGDYDREPWFTTGAWRFTAVQLGGIEALLAETRLAMSEAARGDPLQRGKFADAVVATRTAYLWVRECAIRAAKDDPDGPAFARMTRGVVERAGLNVMELAARIVGTRSAMDGQRIDKIIRDLSLYLRQGGPDYARDQAAIAWLNHDVWGVEDALW
ncbi:acyl-CoA dehydrogenase family protein [Sphingobium algorifonticola]|uniref:Acyl-CoA dehydrogenase n=1 Tax=Sphingobium algorifonticola TaxID=2008318 RepID=A0A437J9U5_9SPHN|nr:acyl-CoA dehydrogenase family protein [Sphingobium algorifonticola]RVT42286.1 acyl-CoA dehydrogenase [Sphingobium algorifonticola]